MYQILSATHMYRWSFDTLSALVAGWTKGRTLFSIAERCRKWGARRCFHVRWKWIGSGKMIGWGIFMEVGRGSISSNFWLGSSRWTQKTTDELRIVLIIHYVSAIANVVNGPYKNLTQPVAGLYKNNYIRIRSGIFEDSICSRKNAALFHGPLTGWERIHYSETICFAVSNQVCPLEITMHLTVGLGEDPVIFWLHMQRFFCSLQKCPYDWWNVHKIFEPHMNQVGIGRAQCGSRNLFIIRRYILIPKSYPSLKGIEPKMTPTCCCIRLKNPRVCWGHR